MYDRVKVEYRYDEAIALRNILESIKVDPQHDEVLIGYLDGIRLRYGYGVLQISGSLLKYAMPNQLGNPSLDALKHAYDVLKCKLHIPEDAEGTVRYLEVGWNITVNRPVMEYLSFLRPVGRYQFSSINMNNGNGIYFANENRVIAAYDKIKERKKKRDNVYRMYPETHMLRLEVRFRRSVNAWLKEYLGRDIVTMEDLFRRDDCQALMEYVQSEINYILPDIHSGNAEWTTPRELIRLLAGQAVELDGGAEVAARRIDLQRKAGRIRARVARDARRAVYDAYDKYKAIENADLREEVVRSISNIATRSVSEHG